MSRLEGIPNSIFRGENKVEYSGNLTDTESLTLMYPRSLAPNLCDSLAIRQSFHISPPNEAHELRWCSASCPMYSCSKGSTSFRGTQIHDMIRTWCGMPRTVPRSFLFFVSQFPDKHRAVGFGSCATHSQYFSCDSDWEGATPRTPSLLLLRDSDFVLFAIASWSTSMIQIASQ